MLRQRAQEIGPTEGELNDRIAERELGQDSQVQVPWRSNHTVVEHGESIETQQAEGNVQQMALQLERWQGTSIDFR